MRFPSFIRQLIWTQIFFSPFYFRNQCNDVHGHTRIQKKNTNKSPISWFYVDTEAKRWSLVHDSTIIGLEIGKRKQFRLALIDFFFHSDHLHFVMSMWLSICILRLCFVFFVFWFLMSMYYSLCLPIESIRLLDKCLQWNGININHLAGTHTK